MKCQDERRYSKRVAICSGVVDGEPREEVIEAEERADANSALLFGRLDFRVTRVMILAAAAGSRTELSRNIDLRHGDVLAARGRERG